MKTVKKVKEAVEKAVKSVKKTAPKKTVAKKPSYPEVKFGAEGELVVQLQDLLSKHGSSIKISGKFNVGTLSAVKSFQKKNGLGITGVVNKKTWDALIKIK